MTIEEFAQRMARAVRDQGVAAAIEIDLPARKLRYRQDAAVHEIFLGNAYTEYLAADRARRPQVIAKYARITRPSPLAGDELRARLLPKAAPRREREALALRHSGGVTNLTRGRRIGDTLQLELAVDEPDRIRLVSASDLEEASLPEDRAFELAIGNLAARSKERWKPIAPGVLQSPWADFFDGARLAIPSLFRDLGLRGDPIVVAANRCAVLATASEEPEGLARLYATACAVMKQERPLDLTPYRLDGDRWRPLGDPDLEVIARAPDLLFLSSLQAALDHDMLGELIAARLATRGLTAVPMRHAESRGIVMNVADLPVAPGSAVPHADLFVCQRASGQQQIAAWYKIEAALGRDLAAIDGIWPPHYEVRRRLSDAELDPMR